jgi:putative SOS response-associated peptidase YedK
MCGRYTLRSPGPLIARIFGLAADPGLAPRYNIAPSQAVAVVRQADGERRLDMLRWGLVPSWARDPSMGNRMINARGETVHDKPAFRTAFRRRRCLVPADGFYEWQQQDHGKQPFYIRMREERPFAIAGLWEHWTGPDGEPLETCTLITTAPNELLAPIHDRMPVILPPAAWTTWLDPDNQDTELLRALLLPYPANDMTAYPVGRRVNNPRSDDPECIAAVG